MRRRSIVAALAFALSFTGHLSAQLVFDDGGSHTLTGNVNDDVYVSNQSHVTIDASSLNADVYVTNATVDHVRGDVSSSSRMTLSDHSVFNSHRRGNGLYKIVDSEANFYAGLYLEGDALNASGSSIVNLHGGQFDETTGERIVIQGDTEIHVGSEATVRVPIFLSGSSHGDARDAIVASLVMRDSSTFDVYGGILSDASADDNWRDRSLRLFDDAKFTMTGGTINSWYDSFSPMIKTHQRSQVVLSDVQNGDGVHYQFWGGNVGVALFHSTGESLIQIDSGQFHVHLTDISGLIMTQALSLLEGNSNSVVNGGQFRISNNNGLFGDRRLDIFELRGTSHVLITGGEFVAIGRAEDPVPTWSPHIVFATQQSRADILGGTFNLCLETPGDRDNFIRHLDARDSATIALHGSGFNYPLGPVSDLEGTITGFLLDGSPIEWNFLRESTARIVLVPEPSAGLLFLGGSALLAVRLRRSGNGQSAAATRRPTISRSLAGGDCSTKARQSECSGPRQ